MPSTFTRSNHDLGNYYFGITPTGGICPNGLPAGAAGLLRAAELAARPTTIAIAEKDSEPGRPTTGAALSAL